jgi:hypothetical protein
MKSETTKRDYSRGGRRSNRVGYIREYRLCISIMGNYRGGNRSSPARYNRTAPRPRHVRSLRSSPPPFSLAPLSPSLFLALSSRSPACRPVCLPARLSALLSILPTLSHADNRVSQLSLSDSEGPVAPRVLIEGPSGATKGERNCGACLSVSRHFAKSLCDNSCEVI